MPNVTRPPLSGVASSTVLVRLRSAAGGTTIVAVAESLEWSGSLCRRPDTAAVLSIVPESTTWALICRVTLAPWARLPMVQSPLVTL